MMEMGGNSNISFDLLRCNYPGKILIPGKLLGAGKGYTLPWNLSAVVSWNLTRKGDAVERVGESHGTNTQILRGRNSSLLYPIKTKLEDNKNYNPYLGALRTD